jgi:hypothetical protein
MIDATKLSPAELQAWVAALGEFLGRKQEKDEGARGAALCAYDRESADAWKSDQEFSNALYMAYVAGDLKLLRDYIAAGKTVPEEHAFVAGKVVPMDVLSAELLGCRTQQQQKPGRHHRVASEAPAVEQAERNAAWLVAFAQKSWRERNCRKRVPGAEVKKMITAAIAEAAKAFHVPVNAIYECNVRNLLKTGRIVVR